MQFRDKIRENITTSGQHLTGVFASVDDENAKDFVPFIYTIGNHEVGFPALLCVGNFPPNMVGMLLNHFGKLMREAGLINPLSTKDEEVIDIDWTMPIKVRKTSDLAKSHFTIQAGQFYGHEDYEVLQLMVPDKNGKFPGDEECDPDFNVEQV